MVRRLGKSLLVAVVTVVVLVFLAGATRTLVVMRVPSASMSPAVRVGGRILAARRFVSPAVGQIWTVRVPAAATTGECVERPAPSTVCAVPLPGRTVTTFVTRLVAAPGDRISVRGGRLVRNGRLERRRRLGACTERSTCEFPRTVTVPEGTWFAMGDNRGDADDSRFWGPLRRSQLDGRVLVTR